MAHRLATATPTPSHIGSEPSSSTISFPQYTYLHLSLPSVSQLLRLPFRVQPLFPLAPHKLLETPVGALPLLDALPRSLDLLLVPLPLLRPQEGRVRLLPRAGDEFTASGEVLRSARSVLLRGRESGKTGVTPSGVKTRPKGSAFTLSIS